MANANAVISKDDNMKYGFDISNAMLFNNCVMEYDEELFTLDHEWWFKLIDF